MKNLLVLSILLSASSAFASDSKVFSCSFDLERKGFWGYTKKNDLAYSYANKSEDKLLKGLESSSIKRKFELTPSSQKEVKIDIVRLLPILKSRGTKDYSYLEKFNVLNFRDNTTKFQGGEDVRLSVKSTGATMNFTFANKVDGSIDISRNYSGAFLPGMKEEASMTDFSATYYFTTQGFDVSKQAKFKERNDKFKYYALLVDCKFSQGTMNDESRGESDSLLDDIVQPEPQLVNTSAVTEE